jgi:uroporphyrinogen decarboxylase
MSKFLDIFRGKYSSPPVWFMRQAGRYLPEYREVRKQTGSFMDLCFNPDKAAQVTLQPIERFGFDAAILFSDILVIPYALGQGVSFEEGKGPILTELPSWNGLNLTNILPKLEPVYEAATLVKKQLPSNTPLLGFAGAPWTIALYMLEGEGSRDFAKAKTRAFSNENEFDALLDILVTAITQHLEAQIKAGVDALQIFETWASLCPSTHFDKWVIEPTRKIVSNLRKSYPDLPIISFPKGVGSQLVKYTGLGISALSLDISVSPQWARLNLPRSLILQGNLDPLLLVAGGKPLFEAICNIHDQMRDRPYIFNLGHGILPQTPIQHVEECITWVRALESQKQPSSCSI